MESMKKLLFTLLLFPCLANAASWECVGRVLTCHTWRMEVPTGWIIAGDNSRGGDETSYAMTFVPDPSHTWR